MPSDWPRAATDPVSEFLLPRWYGSIPTVFGAPSAESSQDLADADVAFLGIPWQAPQPDSRPGAAAAAFAGTVLTPQQFRLNSLKYGGYLPELNIDVFEHFRLADCGNADIVGDPDATIKGVVQHVKMILSAGCIPFTVGGNGGVASYPVLKAIGECADGPIGVINLDAHGDNDEESAAERNDLRRPRWAGTWANRIFEIGQLDPARYVHIGLRGPRNDSGTIPRFVKLGVPRDQIYTYTEIAAARRSGIEATISQIVERATIGTSKVWLAIDPDVLDMSVSPEYGDEPLGISAEEMLLISREVGRQCGRQRLGGISFMAIPPDAMTIQWLCMYAFLYVLAGMLEHEDALP